MLRTFLEIILAFLATYGGYCLIINLFYIVFCKNKSKIRIAYLAGKEKNTFSEIFFAKKAFLGRIHAIILLDYDLGENTLKEIRQQIPETDIYRAERIERFER